MNNRSQDVVYLTSDSASIKHLISKDKRIAKVISMIGPISYVIYNDPYEFLIHEIIEQMLSIKASSKIFQRLVNLCDGKITPYAINNLTDAQIKGIGTSNSKVTFIRAITHAVESKQIDFEKLKEMSDAEVFSELIKIKGVGKWTAKMYLIFVLNRQDVLPVEDVAFLQAYKWLYKKDVITKSDIQKHRYKWKPYSSIAARYLYRALDDGLTKEEFHLYKGD